MINFEDADDLRMTLTEFELDNIRDILMEPTKYNWFSAHLLRLCQKADEEDLRKLSTIYPDAVAAFLIYWTYGIPEKFRDLLPKWEMYIKMMSPRIHKRSKVK